jgi:hypothetical protein
MGGNLSRCMLFLPECRSCWGRRVFSRFACVTRLRRLVRAGTYHLDAATWPDALTIWGRGARWAGLTKRSALMTLCWLQDLTLCRFERVEGPDRWGRGIRVRHLIRDTL